MDRKLTKEEKGVLGAVKAYNGYQPCKGSDLIPVLDSLVAKSYLHKRDDSYFFGKRPKHIGEYVKVEIEEVEGLGFRALGIQDYGPEHQGQLSPKWRKTLKTAIKDARTHPVSSHLPIPPCVTLRRFTTPEQKEQAGKAIKKFTRSVEDIRAGMLGID